MFRFWKSSNRCFLCEEKLDRNYGIIKYKYNHNGMEKLGEKRICEKCVSELDETEKDTKQPFVDDEDDEDADTI